jgi:outer membrane beta-barrel protein
VNYGTSTVGNPTYEATGLLGNSLSEKGYDFNYVSLLGGYNVLSGRSFLGKNYKFNSAIYLLAGVAQVDFADASENGLVVGVSYRAVITDWLTMNLDLSDIVLNRIYLNEEKKTNNAEMRIGVNFLF